MNACKKNDWFASLIIPGWTQLMYFSPLAAVLFFGIALYCYIELPWYYGASIHIWSALHGWVLVRDHFSGKRPAVAPPREDHAR